MKKKSDYEFIIRQADFYIYQKSMEVGYAHFQELLGEDIEDKFFFTKKNINELYRNKEQFEKLKKNLKKKIEKNPEKYFAIFDKINYYNQKIVEIIKNTYNKEQLIRTINELESFIDNYWKYYIPAAFIGYSLDDNYLETHKQHKEIITKYKYKSYWVGLWEFLSKEFKKHIHNKLLESMSLEEIKNILEGKKIDMKKVVERNNAYFYNLKTKKYILGEEAILKMNSIFKKESFKNVKELKGTTANKGHAKGRTKIVLTKEDFLKVEKGDIIVASMTNALYVPIIGKCAAIITNEGGQTTHAAIISREMKKPCIVGTKIATKIFKDGDMVEVDANKGVVRKL